MKSSIEYLQETIAFYLKNYRSLILYSFISALLTAIISVTNLATDGHFITATPIVFDLITLLVSTLMTLSIYQIVNKLLHKEKPLTFSQQIKITKSSYLRYLLTSLIVATIIIAGLILFIFPGIIFAVWYFAATYIAATTSSKPLIALDKSKQLVQGHWLELFLRFAYLISVVCLPILLIYIIFSAILPDNIFSYVEILLSLFFATFMMPYSAIVVAIIFHDLSKIYSSNSATEVVE